jgi:Anti-sigma-K factor rskA, C-terminal
MEAFEGTTVVRYYGEEVEAAEPEPADASPGPIAEPARLHVLHAEPLRAARPIVALAVLAGLAAVGLATWAFVSAIRAADDGPTAAPTRSATAPQPDPGLQRALALLALPTTQRFRVAGSRGRVILAVTPGDRGYLVLRGLGRAPAGRIYQAWVIPPAGRSMRRGAAFRGETAVVALRGRVHDGAAVAITLEHVGSRATGPSHTPRLVALRRP